MDNVKYYIIIMSQLVVRGRQSVIAADRKGEGEKDQGEREKGERENDGNGEREIGEGEVERELVSERDIVNPD